MFTFVNFKNFADAKLDLDRPLTILIGKNGAGKSNAIEGVELLAELCGGRPLTEISDIGRGGRFEIRGGLLACARSGQSSQFLLGWTTSAPPESYNIKVETSPEPAVVQEILNVYKKEIPATKRSSVTRKPKVPSLPVVAAKSTYPSGSRQKASLYLTTNYAVEHVKNIRVFDLQPKLMRAYERIGNHTLMRNGSNLSAALYALHSGRAAEKKTLARILESIKQLPEEPYGSFDFVTTSLNDVIFGLKETAKGPLMDARLLSDGTLRSLAVLTALETVAEGSRVIFEEFDNGLHPSRVGVLTQAIWEASTRRKLNVLVTTHNPATLDSLTPEQLQGVVLCFWDKQQQASRLLPLLELPRADVLLERGQLGDLVTQRVLEQHLAPGFAEDQQRKAEAWLERLK